MSQRIVLRTILAVAVIGLLVIVGLTPQAVAQGRSDRALQHVIDVQEKHTQALMAMPGVAGTGVGHNREGDLAVKVFVETGADAVGIPRHLDGVPVAVQVTGRIFALKGRPEAKPGGGIDPTAQFVRPVPIGISTGHPNITAGTIGCRVKDGSNVYALSNNHVYADENNANPGDSALQPGPFDGGIDPDDKIGTLQDFEPIVFSTSANNVIDAAIAMSSTADLGNATPSDGYGAPKSATVIPIIGMKVMKYGRTTRLTPGEIGAINATVNVGYSSGTARFVNQIIVTPGTFSDGGDSGSCIVADDTTTTGKGKNKVVTEGPNHLKVVGLLFAGSPVVTVANPINAVLTHFGVTIDGQ